MKRMAINSQTGVPTEANSDPKQAFYACEECPFVAKSKRGVAQHRCPPGLLLRSKLPRCLLCPDSGPVKAYEDLKLHFESFHGLRVISMRSKRVRSAVFTDPGQFYACRQCSLTSVSFHEVSNHKCTGRRILPRRRLGCAYCPADETPTAIPTYEDLAKHLETAHGLKRDFVQSSQTVADAGEVLKGKPSNSSHFFVCARCSVTVTTNQAILRHHCFGKHGAGMHRFLCDRCPEKVTTDFSSSEHLAHHYENEHGRQRVQVHISEEKEHLRGPPHHFYACARCPYVANSSTSVLKHRCPKSKILTLKPPSCLVCGLETAFSSYKYLEAHLTKKHGHIRVEMTIGRASVVASKASEHQNAGQRRPTPKAECVQRNLRHLGLAEQPKLTDRFKQHQFQLCRRLFTRFRHAGIHRVVWSGVRVFHLPSHSLPAQSLTAFGAVSGCGKAKLIILPPGTKLTPSVYQHRCLSPTIRHLRTHIFPEDSPREGHFVWLPEDVRKPYASAKETLDWLRTNRVDLVKPTQWPRHLRDLSVMDRFVWPQMEAKVDGNCADLEDAHSLERCFAVWLRAAGPISDRFDRSVPVAFSIL